MCPNGGASRWRVCYQWVLPRLVYLTMKIVLHCQGAQLFIKEGESSYDNDSECAMQCSAVQ